MEGDQDESGGRLDIMTISDSAFSAYMDCPYKAFLTLQRFKGTQRPFHKLQSRLHHKLLPRVESEILRVLAPRTLSRKARTAASDLRRGPFLILNTVLISSPYTCRVAALQRVDGASSLGSFHYTPILFQEDAAISTSHKLLLAFAAHILGRAQGHAPSMGHIVAGTSCTLKPVSLKGLSQQVQDIVEELHRYASECSQPRQVLNPHCHICRYHDHCESDAQRTDDLSRLQGIHATDIGKLNAKGIFTVHQLSHTFRPRKRPTRQADREYIPYHHSLKALAIREQKIHVFQRPPTVTAPTRAYLDMEGDHAARHVYLIGLLVVRGNSQKYTAFWAEKSDDEERIFRALFDRLARLDDCHLFHYGSYDGRALKRMIHLAPTEGVKNLVANNTTNILANIYAQVYFPTYGNRLKDVAAFLGFDWTYPDYSGKEAILLRHLWELGHSAQIRSLLTIYNRDDCMALRLVHETIEKLATAHKPVGFPSSTVKQGQEAAASVSADSLMHASDYKDWGRREFSREEFRLVADAAYFDYQRNRIYVRTSSKVKRYQRRLKKLGAIEVGRPNKTIDHTVTACPRCKSDDLVLDYQEGTSKYAYDLRVSRGAIRKWVTRRRIPRHECDSCKHVFTPGGPRSQQRLGHNLLAWAMHQHVTNRISLANLAITARECFGLELGEWDFQRLKSMAGSYYRDTYESLLRELVKGPLLHIDETSVWLRGHLTGYVWVFTSMESVVFMYRSTREGEFLHDLLRLFKGVLVTDFYTAYDSIGCPQQKCLVHLMWDINRALLKHPFDEKLNEIGRTFGALMRDIVGTIDRYGLKSRYLGRHRKETSRWLRELRESPGKSIIAEKVRKRIVKYGERLFTFFDYDGVPWNNNNAENSIKPFAKYRRLVRGRITEPGLRDYLVLLSIAHTCKYRGVSLLEFLLSRSKQIPD